MWFIWLIFQHQHYKVHTRFIQGFSYHFLVCLYCWLSPALHRSIYLIQWKWFYDICNSRCDSSSRHLDIRITRFRWDFYYYYHLGYMYCWLSLALHCLICLIKWKWLYVCISRCDSSSRHLNIRITRFRRSACYYHIGCMYCWSLSTDIERWAHSLLCTPSKETSWK